MNLVREGAGLDKYAPEECQSSAEHEIRNRPKRLIPNQLLRNDILLVTIIDMARKASWSSMGDAASHDQPGLKTSTLGSLEHGTTRVAIFIDTDRTIVRFDTTGVGGCTCGRVGDVRVGGAGANRANLDGVGAELPNIRLE